MSYCRWSSMNWMCDIYAYESVGDYWAVHVAGRRLAHEPPEPPPVPKHGAAKHEYEEWATIYKKCNDERDKIPYIDLDLPHAGESFQEPTLEDFRDRLTMLREAGYNVPDYVFDEIAEEMAEDGLAPLSA